MISQEQCGLSSETQSKLIAVFKKHPGVLTAILYGSRAKGNFRSSSDIDLTVEGPQLALRELLAIENEIDDLLLPYKVDLSLLHQIESPGLRDHIDRVGVVFFEK